MEKILAFGCHPDDVEYGCAGSLALLAERGYEIHIATMTGGEAGSPTLASQAIRQRRLQEAERAAAIIGASFHYAGGHDLEVEFNAEYRQRAVRILREVDPLIVFTTPPSDYLADHEETSKLVRNAAYIASVPNFDHGTSAPATRRFPYLYYWNAAGLTDILGRPLPLTCRVDITTVIETKARMYACHESQREWLKYHNSWSDFVEIMKLDAAREGQPAGVRWAEGFIQHRSLGHPHDNILKTILMDWCIEV